MAVYVRSLPGSQLVQSVDRLEYQERVRLEGVIGSNWEQWAYNALTDPALPILGDGLTSFSNMALAERRIDNVQCVGAQTTVFLTLSYRSYSTQFVSNPNDNGPGERTIATTVESVETTLDKNGDPIVVTYDGRQQIARVTRLRVATVIVFRRWESSEPTSRASNYTGRRNTSTWNGFPARTIILREVTSTTDDGGDSYHVEYRFEYEPDEHKVIAAFVEPGTGQVPEDANFTAPGGLLEVDAFDDADYSGLSISL